MASWNRTQSHHFDLAPEVLWPVIADPSALPLWNRAVAALVPRTADPAPGTALDFEPRPALIGAIHARTAPPAVVVRRVAGREFSWRQPQPGGGLLVRWELRPEHGGTRLVQTVSVDGPGTPLFGPSSAGPLAAGFAENCARLHRLAGGSATREPKIVIAGGSGFLGRRLAADLACRNHDVVVLTRSHDPGSPFRQVAWDGAGPGAWTRELEHAGPVAVVNLAGRSVDCRPSPGHVAALRDSRVRSTRALVEACAALPRPVSRWVQASTTAVYGDAGEDRLDEHSALPSGGAALPQMTGVAVPWEKAAAGANTHHQTILRTAIVLERECPAFDRLSLLARAGLGGPVGDGRQWFSWIHLEDWLGVVRAGLGLEPSVELPSGVVVAAAPEPVRNAELMSMLRERLAPRRLRRWSVPAPAPLVRLGALALGTDPALGLTGRHATSAVLGDAGFAFRHPRLGAALSDITG
ncbi:DUF1731 domain-containing protein [Arthrobacter halodurans]|uniref:DUF1731 domain-containing protein n=1 Tax=Arthrobacter halodurans TaxID=516699 RepID=A0ABV4UJN6_9MICC